MTAQLTNTIQILDWLLHEATTEELAEVDRQIWQHNPEAPPNARVGRLISEDE